MNRQPLVVRNDWTRIQRPDIGAWQPALPVSVVIPAYSCQDTLDRTLASLSVQTYPSQLLEVVVVDDGSEPPLTLGEIRPGNCRIVHATARGSGWGIAAAFNLGVEMSAGSIIQRLDADMVVFPDHIEAHARWHHQAPYAVTLGSKLFVEAPPEGQSWPEPAVVASSAEHGRMAELFDLGRAEPHAYIDRMLRRTDHLRRADHVGFLAHVGATVALRRELFDATGGLNEALRRGSDTEFGYRLAQAGALFVPETEARSWHLGHSHMMANAKPIQRYSRPFLADVMPHPRWLRTVGGSAWTVPLVTAVMDVTDQPLERVRVAVDALLRGDETDLRVLLVGAWDSVVDTRRPILDDPALELRLIRATYRSDPRVRFVDEPPSSAFPSPYLMTVPATFGLAPSAVRHLVDFADLHQAGVVSVAPPHGRDGEPLTLWRTAARARAGWVFGAPSIEAVDGVFGARSMSADEAGVADLTEYDAEALAAGIEITGTGRGSWRTGGYVKVAGVRSLAKAVAMVAALSVSRARARARRLVARRPWPSTVRTYRRSGDRS
jgi:GT2 family glycosyltransferase